MKLVECEVSTPFVYTQSVFVVDMLTLSTPNEITDVGFVSCAALTSVLYKWESGFETTPPLCEVKSR